VSDARTLLRQGARRFGLELDRARLRLRRRAGRARPLDPGLALDRVPADPDVLFLCHGNVCRSPLAERRARQRAPEGVGSFDSAGFVSQTGRESPDEAVAAAREHGVDLSDHRSARVTRAALAASDLVVVMDVRNYRHLRRAFPAFADRAWFLRPFGPTGGVEVTDPYGGGPETFAAVYGTVVDAVDGLVAALEREAAPSG
jgi:protein-tyrosine phosphatase